jgi:hypothetical protein
MSARTTCVCDACVLNGCICNVWGLVCAVDCARFFKTFFFLAPLVRSWFACQNGLGLVFVSAVFVFLCFLCMFASIPCSKWHINDRLSWFFQKSHLPRPLVFMNCVCALRVRGVCCLYVPHVCVPCMMPHDVDRSGWCLCL